MGETVRMAVDRKLASPDDMRSYLVDQLNLMLRRPGMYGDVEVGAWLAIDHLLFLEQRHEVWGVRRDDPWAEAGFCPPAGVSGAVRPLLPADYEHGTASVYAEFAWRQGWLKPDRVLDSETYASLRSLIGPFARHDRVWADVREAFGPPSVLLGGTNPHYGKTLGYVTEDVAEPMIAFHLWNGSDPGPDSAWPPDREQPLLLAVRCGEGPFADRFTFTPEGRRRRPDNAWTPC
ncbi:hypothetical protein [Streptomyces albidoflavus]|uniref:hypothetical protein n=1 Tax=Streptomyces albidoflavus TaxID=1886 RepID=UPI0033B9D967